MEPTANRVPTVGLAPLYFFITYDSFHMEQSTLISVNKIIAQYQNKGAFYLDYNDPDMRQFFDYQLELAQVKREWYPAFYTHLEQSAQQAPTLPLTLLGARAGIHPVHTISSINWTEAKHLEATAITSIPEIAVHINQTLGFFNEQREPIGPVAHSQTYNQGNESVIQASAPIPDDLEARNIVVIYTFTQTIDDALVPAAEVVSTIRYPQNISNLKPTNVLGNNQIKVCLTRTAGDCDYSHPYPGANHVLVPIEGSMTYFGNIDLSEGKPVNANAEIYLIRVMEGGSIIGPADGFQFFNAAGVSISGKTLSWNLDWLKFNQVDFQPGDQVYYVFKVSLQVEGEAVVGFITNAPNSVAPGQTIRNTFSLPPMYILYGCLAAGTPVQLSDGTYRAIEDVQLGDWVRSARGEALCVEDLTRGTEEACLRISYRNGAGETRRLVASPGHPCKLVSGVKQAAELVPGDQLEGLMERWEVVNIEAVEETVVVHNLHLGKRSLPERQLRQGSFLVAEGILVGDARMQRVVAKSREQKVPNILEQLPEAWKQDYQNYLRYGRPQ
ncbi:MAG: Hint domain-containing protein [Bacteroidota bacterium]